MRALLELGETQLFGDIEGAAFTHAEAALGVLIGRPSAKTLIECGPQPEFLAHAPVELARYAWKQLRLLTSPPALGAGGAVRLTPERWARVPAPLSEALAVAMERRAVFCDEQLTCFAWAPWRSERWFDLHVEPLANSEAVLWALIHHERKEAREPVWSATDEATFAFARSLGFVDSGQTIWRARKKP